MGCWESHQHGIHGMLHVSFKLMSSCKIIFAQIHDFVALYVCEFSLLVIQFSIKTLGLGMSITSTAWNIWYVPLCVVILAFKRGMSILLRFACHLNDCVVFWCISIQSEPLLLGSTSRHIHFCYKHVYRHRLSNPRSP